jgi:hypothetical protein
MDAGAARTHANARAPTRTRARPAHAQAHARMCTLNPRTHALTCTGNPSFSSMISFSTYLHACVVRRVSCRRVAPCRGTGVMLHDECACPVRWQPPLSTRMHHRAHVARVCEPAKVTLCCGPPHTRCDAA